MIRQLRPGEPIPNWPPRRYKAGHGYIRLRWRIGPNQLVETYEHRVDGDHVTTAEHVHHKNRKRDDNRPENLEHLTVEEHQAEHYAEDRRRIMPAAQLYLSGLSTTQVGERLGVDPSCVSRMLQRAGVPTRPSSSYAKPIDADEIVRRYLSGQGVRRIKADLRLSDERVKAVLRAAGVQLRGPGRVPASALREAS